MSALPSTGWIWPIMPTHMDSKGTNVDLMHGGTGITSSSLSTMISPIFVSSRSRLPGMSSGRTTRMPMWPSVFWLPDPGISSDKWKPRVQFYDARRGLSTWTTWRPRSSLQLKPLRSTVPVVTITSSIPSPRRNILG